MLLTGKYNPTEVETLYAVYSREEANTGGSSTGMMENTRNAYPVTMRFDDTVEVEVVSETCTEPGHTAGLYCNTCETYFPGHETIPATATMKTVFACPARMSLSQ